MSYSIDWLSVYQIFTAGSIPVFGSTVVLELDNQGELQKEYIKGFKHEGSYSTSIAIKSDGTRLSVSGNPSKYCRLDNIFGFQTIEQCLKLYNSILSELGLPGFYDNPATYLRPHQFQTSDQVLLNRPILTRVDICKNYTVGSHVSTFLNWLVSQSSRSGSAKIYPDGNTVEWNGGSRRIYFKYYDKAAELKRHRKKVKDKADLQYLDDLIQWSENSGLVRFEISLKAMQLKRTGLDNAANWSQSIMGEIVTEYAFHHRVKNQDTPRSHPLDTLIADLIEQGVSPRVAHQCNIAARAWMSGADVRKDVSKSTFYRLRKPLLGVGIDIKYPSNVRTMLPRTFDIKIEEAIPPAFYRSIA